MPKSYISHCERVWWADFIIPVVPSQPWSNRKLGCNYFGVLNSKRQYNLQCGVVGLWASITVWKIGGKSWVPAVVWRLAHPLLTPTPFLFSIDGPGFATLPCEGPYLMTNLIFPTLLSGWKISLNYSLLIIISILNSGSKKGEI